MHCIARAARARTQACAFSTSRAVNSYIGGAAITLPENVTLEPWQASTAASQAPARSTVQTQTKYIITGPEGSLDLAVPHFVTFKQTPTSVTVSVQDANIKRQRAMWGTTRALLQNCVRGVAEGYVVTITFVGVGYRAAVEAAAAGQLESTGTVVLRVGYSKPVSLPLPKGIAASCSQPTVLMLRGVDKQALTQFAAVIRSYRPPEPYKGKGIFVNGETIRIKDKKKGK